MNIGIYVEGGHYLGLGNVYRMLSLAKSLAKEHLINIFFITTSDHTVTDLINGQGFTNVIRKADLAGVNSCLESLDLAILIIDVLDIDVNFVKNIKELYPLKIVLFGNNNEANDFSDLVVNAIISTKQFRNENYVDTFHTHYLKGPKYLTLRDEFRFQSYQYTNTLKHVLLLFGGSDQANLSYKILSDLLIDERLDDVHFNVVLGAAYSNQDSLDQFISNGNVTILKNITNVSEVMLANDFLLTSAGTAYFEGLYLGLPSVAFFQNSAQREVFGNFFNTFEYKEVLSVVDLMLDVFVNYDSFSKSVGELGVGMGKKEIIETILNLKK